MERFPDGNAVWYFMSRNRNDKLVRNKETALEQL